MGNGTSPCEVWMMSFHYVGLIFNLVSAFLFTFISICLIHYGKSYHIMFRTIFFLLLATYVFCDIFRFLLESSLFYPYKSFTNFLNIGNEFFYMFASPQVVLVLLERFYATCRVRTYEFSRPWSILIVCQVLGVIISLIHVHLQLDGNADTAKKSRSQVVLCLASLLIVVLLTWLLLANRRLSLNARAKASLTHRYQLNENIKALRMLVPVVVLDSAISVNDVLAYVLFDVDAMFSVEQCQRRSYYTPALCIFRLFSMAFEICIPIFVLRHYSNFLRDLRAYTFRSKRKRSFVGPSHNNVLKIKNVLGMDIVGLNDNADYFDVLQRTWMKKF
ncbi:unnamed protein product [Caenorhabditis auriculariae]|uniref:G-protein coupled receptors family 1 profile domain-containing protein n=1 Tax=Caenorhabditis auriculariae TaxID=2777116 RepID=A0A8S1HX65_9PELO|nr:unnamed protein product [Caenorhabditis auriculariae]